MACNYKKYLNGTQIITFQFYKPPLSCYSKTTFHEMHVIIPVFTGKFQKSINIGRTAYDNRNTMEQLE